MTAFGILAWVCLGLAALPLCLIVANLRLLRPLPRRDHAAAISVLIPARNEAANIGSAIESVLANAAANFECLVLDDDSTDGTAAIVARWSARDARVRLVPGRGHDPALWGKPQACATLAAAASGEILVFMDADVRLEPDALGRIAAALTESDTALLSGVPRQVTRGLGEKLIVPLIEFVLLGYLPLAAMRRSPMPGFGVACGQLLAVRRDAYVAAGGHRVIAHRIHDGMALARLMRTAGYRTDLADFGDLASCRMYSSLAALIEGFAKNAHEGLGSARGIAPWTLLLIGGQCAWIGLLLAAPAGAPRLPVLLAGLASYLSRALLTLRFRQSGIGAALHPVGVFALVLIQWYAALRRLVGRPVAWKARVRRDTPAARTRIRSIPR